MEKPDIFPIHIISYDNHSHYWLNKIWIANKAENESWYLVDGKILSPNILELSVYGMLDNYHGGKGKLLKTLTITKFSKEEQEIIDKIIMENKWRWCRNEFNRREAEREKERAKKEIKSIYKQYFKKV